VIREGRDPWDSGLLFLVSQQVHSHRWIVNFESTGSPGSNELTRS